MDFTTFYNNLFHSLLPTLMQMLTTLFQSWNVK